MANTERSSIEFGWEQTSEGSFWEPFDAITDADYSDPARIAANYERALVSARRNIAFKRERAKRFAAYRRANGLAPQDGPPAGPVS